MKKIVPERCSSFLRAVRSKKSSKVACKSFLHPTKRTSRNSQAAEPEQSARMRAAIERAATPCLLALPPPSSPPAPPSPWDTPPPPPPPVLGRLTMPTSALAAPTLSARLDRCLPVPHLHIIDPAVPHSFPIDPAAVAGLADGASVDLSLCATLADAVVYQLSAPLAAFASSMVGRVLQAPSGERFVEALQPHGPYRRLRLEPGAEARPGELVVASLDAPQSSLARVVGKLADPHAALTGICAIAADCGARFGHSSEVTGHAWNIRREQRCPTQSMTDVPFFTLDPKGTRVLDQAMHLERGLVGGYLLHYAIADGGALVPMGSPCDEAAQDRGSAIYLQASMPEELSTSLHMLPDTLTQDAGSLVEQKTRPALVVTVTLDAHCNITDCTAKRTVIQSLQQVTTQQVQWYYDNNMSSRLVAQPFAPSLTLLREVGQKLVQRAKLRGATAVLQAETMAKSDLVVSAAGDVRAYEKRDVEVSQYNGQISMLVNEAVASKLAGAHVKAPYLGGTGAGRDDARLRSQLTALGFAWPAGLGLDVYLASLPATDPRTVAIRHLVLAQNSATAFCARPIPHAMLGLPAYTNLTAPLRRYQDMVVQRIVDAAFTGTQPIPYQDDASIAAVLTSANIGRERQRLINLRTHGVRTAAYLRPHVGKTLAAKVVSCAGTTAVVELEEAKVRLPLRLSAGAAPLRVHATGVVHVLAADVITCACEIAWGAAPAPIV